MVNLNMGRRVVSCLCLALFLLQCSALITSAFAVPKKTKSKPSVQKNGGKVDVSSLSSNKTTPKWKKTVEANKRRRESPLGRISDGSPEGVTPVLLGKTSGSAEKNPAPVPHSRLQHPDRHEKARTTTQREQRQREGRGPPPRPPRHIKPPVTETHPDPRLSVPHELEKFRVFSCSREVPLSENQLTKLNMVVLPCQSYIYDPRAYISNSTGFLDKVQLRVKYRGNREGYEQFRALVDENLKAGKRVVIQCNRGRHRSVAMAKMFAEKWCSGVEARAIHLDLWKALREGGRVEVLERDGSTRHATEKELAEIEMLECEQFEPELKRGERELSAAGACSGNGSGTGTVGGSTAFCTGECGGERNQSEGTKFCIYCGGRVGGGALDAKAPEFVPRTVVGAALDAAAPEFVPSDHAKATTPLPQEPINNPRQFLAGLCQAHDEPAYLASMPPNFAFLPTYTPGCVVVSSNVRGGAFLPTYTPGSVIPKDLLETLHEKALEALLQNAMGCSAMNYNPGVVLQNAMKAVGGAAVGNAAVGGSAVPTDSRALDQTLAAALGGREQSFREGGAIWQFPFVSKGF